VGGDNPIGPGRPYYVDVGVASRDVAAAKALLDEAGVGDAKLDLYVPGGVGGAQEMALGIQSMLAEVGISVQVQTIPQDVYWAKYWIQQSLKVTNWSPRGTIDEQIRVTYYCNAAWNESHICNSKLDDLLDEARRAVDQSKRAELYRQVQMHFSDLKPAIIPFHMSLVGAATARVKEFNQHPVYYWTDFRRVGLTA
jgi:peptide/nickel transport system substrate-binding protein